MIKHGVNLVLGIYKINALICCDVNLALGKSRSLNAVIMIFVNLVVLKIGYV